MSEEATPTRRRGLQALEAMEPDELRERLAACCGSSRWVASVVASRPWRDVDSLLTAAERAAEGLEKEDWREAFAHHPRIGDVEALRRRFGRRSGSWSEGEQAGLEGTSTEILQRLAADNKRYEERFGWIFLVCATGKNAAEMSTLLEQRLGNAPDEEFDIAAGEQGKITRLRLLKLLDELGVAAWS